MDANALSFTPARKFLSEASKPSLTPDERDGIPGNPLQTPNDLATAALPRTTAHSRPGLSLGGPALTP
jgi:hypothetical protein